MKAGFRFHATTVKAGSKRHAVADSRKDGAVQNIEPSPHRAGHRLRRAYRYLIGDFRAYIYRNDDYGKTWFVYDGKNGIAVEEPSAWFAKIPTVPICVRGKRIRHSIFPSNGAQLAELPG